MPKMIRSDEVARLFGLSVEMVYRLTKEGVIASEAVPGKSARMYPFIATVQAYIRHLRDKATGRSDSREAQAKADLIKRNLEIRRLETKIALEEGRAYDEAAVKVVLNDMLGSFKARLWGLPYNMADRLVGLSDRDQIADILRAEVAGLCEILTSYDARQFYERHPEYEEADDEDEADADGDADDETADV